MKTSRSQITLASAPETESSTGATQAKPKDLTKRRTRHFSASCLYAENTGLAGEGQLYLRLQLCVGWGLLRGLHDGRLCADAGGSGLGGLSHLRGGTVTFTSCRIERSRLRNNTDK